ncbi:hypothetical protein BKA57DRAFT_68826 [Linnemannia elongata]|nr:hypothetical protein BKA57DRAFT_68826 [Linnemannia elongata]
MHVQYSTVFLSLSLSLLRDGVTNSRQLSPFSVHWLVCFLRLWPAPISLILSLSVSLFFSSSLPARVSPRVLPCRPPRHAMPRCCPCSYSCSLVYKPCFTPPCLQVALTMTKTCNYKKKQRTTRSHNQPMNHKTKQRHNLLGPQFSRLIVHGCCCCLELVRMFVSLHLPQRPPSLIDHNNTKENETQPYSTLPATKKYQSSRVVPFFLQVYKENKKDTTDSDDYFGVIDRCTSDMYPLFSHSHSPSLLLTLSLPLLLPSLMHTDMGGKREFENTPFFSRLLMSI